MWLTALVCILVLLDSAGIEEHFHPPENSSLLSQQYLLPSPLPQNKQYTNSSLHGFRSFVPELHINGIT